MGMETVVPMVMRKPDGKMTLANFMQMQLYSALGAMSVGMEILAEENVEIEAICGHGGFFKCPYVGANAMSAALGCPITVMKNAGEGGAWGVALLALFATVSGKTLEEFLDEQFASAERETTVASAQEKAKFGKFMVEYKKYLAVEKLATEL